MGNQQEQQEIRTREQRERAIRIIEGSRLKQTQKDRFAAEIEGSSRSSDTERR